MCMLRAFRVALGVIWPHLNVVILLEWKFLLLFRSSQARKKSSSTHHVHL